MKKISLFFALVLVITSFSFAGLEWTTTMKIESSQKGVGNDITTHAYAQAGNVKQVFENVAKENPFYNTDGYWLYKANENNIYIVNDKEKSYTVLSVDDLLQLTGAFGQLVKMEISDYTANTEVLPGETILGYACNHLKIVTDYTLKVKIAFIKQTMKVHEEKEVWGTTQIQGLKEMNQAFMGKNFKTGIADLDNLIQEEMKKQKEIGFPLKMITKRTDSDTKKGKVQGESTTTMTVTKLETKNFPPSFFEIPSSYFQNENPAMGGGKGKKKFGIF